MKVLILSDNKSIFDSGSAAHKEILRCSEQVDQLHVIILNTKKDPHLFLQVSDKLFLHPTNSTAKIYFLWDVFKIVQSQIFWKSQVVTDLICAGNSFLASLAAYLLSWKYNRNYIIDIHESTFLDPNTENQIVGYIKMRIWDYIFVNASGIRVTSQDIGEIISARNPLLEKKIFILPFVEAEREASAEQTERANKIDIRQKFPQFNIILLSVSKSINIKDLKRARFIMNQLRLRYPRIGLIVVTKLRSSLWHPLFISSLPEYIILEENTIESGAYYQNVNIFIDLESEDHDTREIINALHAGCPIIATDTKANVNIIRDGENGFIMSPQKPELFARKVMEILETPGLRERMRLYRYDITDLYGTDPGDYYKRLITIWEQCKTPEEEMSAQVPVVEPQSAEIGYYPAFTLDTVKKVFKRFEINKRKKRVLRPAYEIRDEVFDVDSVRLGIKEALAEIELDKDFEPEETDDGTKDLEA